MPEPPSTDRSGIDRPGTDRPGTDRPGTDRPGTDRPGSDRPTIVRPLDTPRRAAAERGVSAAMAEVLNRAGADWNPRLLAALYASAALAADDRHAAERDLITQHHGITRADLLLVLGLAGRAVDGRHAGTGTYHADCAECAAVFASGRVRNAVEWTARPSPPARYST